MAVRLLLITLASIISPFSLIMSQGGKVANITSEVSKVELRSYLSYYIPAESDTEVMTIEEVATQSFTQTSQSYMNLNNGNVWAKFSYNATVAQEVILSSRLGNQHNEFQIYYWEDSSWYRQTYSYKTPIDKRAIPNKEVALILPDTDSTNTVYIHSASDNYLLADWVLYTSEEYESHNRLVTYQLFGYLVISVSFVVFALIGGHLLKVRLPIVYALHVFALCLYLVFETNWASTLFFSDSPGLTWRYYPIVTGLLNFSFVLYSWTLFKRGKLPTWLDKSYKVLLILTFASILLGHYLLSSRAGIYGSHSLVYLPILLFAIGAVINYKEHAPTRWFIGGTFVMIFASTLIDFHMLDFINVSWSFYTVIPALVIDMAMVGIGTLIGAKDELQKFALAHQQNEHLKGDVERLRTEVDHTLSAYETLVNRSAAGELNVPKEYYDNPLTAREFQILQLLAASHNNQEIADILHLSRNTIKTHLKKIYQKLSCNSREEAVEMAREYGLI